MAFPVDEKFILEAEGKLALRPPLSYKSRIRQNNGGELEAMDDIWQLYPVFDTSDRKRIARTGNDIVRETAKAREWKSFPSDAVAFADNGTGDKLVFTPFSENPAQLGEAVYFWDHETGKLELISDDLADLLNGLEDA